MATAEARDGKIPAHHTSYPTAELSFKGRRPSASAMAGSTTGQPNFKVTQADKYRKAQPVHYPGYDPHRVHALPCQYYQKLDHLKYVRQVLYQNKENLVRFGVHKEMIKLLHRRAIQKFMLDSYWWFFLDCFAHVNFDAMVQRAKRNQLVSDAEMRAYMKPVVIETGTVGAKARYEQERKELDRTPQEGEGGSDILETDDSGDENTHQLLNDSEEGSVPVEQSKTAVWSPPNSLALAPSVVPDVDEESEEDEEEKERRRKRTEKEEKKKKKLRNTKEDFAPPSHLNAIKAKNRRAEDVALVGSPRCPSVDSLFALVRSHSSDPSEWEDSDASSTTSFVAASYRSEPVSVVSPVKVDGALSSGVSFQEGTVFRPLGERPTTTGSTCVVAGATDSSWLSGEMPREDSGHPETGGVTMTRERIVAQRLLRVKNFHATGPTYALYRMDPVARKSIIASEQHQLFTRMANNYGATIQKLSRVLHYSLKDGITRLLPDILAQLVFLFFHNTMPYATHLFDVEFQEYVWDTFSFWTGGVCRHGNTRGWPVHILVDPLIAHKAEVKALQKASAKTDKHLARMVGVRRGSHFSLVSGSTSTGPGSKKGKEKKMKEPLGIEAEAKRRKPPETARVSPPESTLMKPRAPQTARTKKTPTRPLQGSKKEPSAREAEALGTPQPISTSTTTRPPSLSEEQERAGLADTSGIFSGLAHPPPQKPSAEWQEVHPLGRRRPSERKGSSAALSQLPSAPPLASTTSGSGYDPLKSFLAPNSRTKAMVEKDVELMKTELHRLRTTHTFSQSHWQDTTGGPSATVAVGAANPLRHLQQKTKKATPLAAVVNGGDALDEEEGGDGGGGVVKRTRFAYHLGPQKRTVQVIKAEVDLKYKDATPWYGNPKARIPIKEELGASKFSVRNWSPLVHRYLLGSGEDNRYHEEGMTWTLPDTTGAKKKA